MQTFDTLVNSAALVLLLLTVLRYRQNPIPLPLPLGLYVALIGEIFSIANLVLGEKGLDALLVGENPEITNSFFTINDTEVSEAYFAMMQAFYLISAVGALLIAIGALVLIRRIIRQHSPTLPQVR